MTEVRVTRIRVEVDNDWRPPFELDNDTLRRVPEAEALRSERPHRVVAVGGLFDGYEEWWVADGPCGCHP